MKCTAVALALYAVSASALDAVGSPKAGQYALRELFEKFEADYNRAYATPEEREAKFAVFVANVDDIVSKNEKLAAEGKDQVHGINRFADATAEEFSAMLNPAMGAPVNASVGVATPTKAATSSSFDWRDQGVVTDVKNQKYCGSCWAFSATETIESQYAINGGKLTEFSPQQIVSCDTTDAGCNGGWYYTAWMDYVAPNGGMTTAANYPYDSATSFGHASSCDKTLESETTSGTTPSSYTWATSPCSSFSCNNQDEDTLKSNLASYGPVSIAVDASKWSSYSGGVMTSSSCSSGAFSLDHAVQLVGYNAAASTPYWIVRNSWDTTWGEDGYIYLEMGDNTCGVADKAAMVYLE